MESAPPVLIGERVAWLGSGSGLPSAGLVRWIGKLPEIGPGWTLGLELDKALPIGGIDGDWGGRKLFICKERHGLLVPLGQTARERDLMRGRTRNTPLAERNSLTKPAFRKTAQSKKIAQEIFTSHDFSTEYIKSSKLHENSLSAIGNDLFPPVAATRRKHYRYTPPLKQSRQQQLLEQHQQFLERLKKGESSSNTIEKCPEESYQWFDCQSSLPEENGDTSKDLRSEAIESNSHAMNEDHLDLELPSTSQNGFFSFLRWFRPRKDASANTTPEDTPPQARRRRRSSCASLDTLLSTATAHSFAFVPPSQYHPTSLGRRKRPAPTPPTTSTPQSTSRHRRSASESFKDKRAGAYLHVKGKRRAPQPPTTNSLDRIKPSPFSSLRRKKRVAPLPPPPSDCKLTEEQRDKLIENINRLHSQENKNFQNDILKLEGGVLTSTKEMPREVTATTSCSSATTAPVSPRPWYKRRKDKSLEKHKKEDGDIGKFSLFSEKRKDEKRKSQLSMLANISELDRQAAAIVQKEQAKEQAALEAQDAKFYEQLPDSPALGKAAANREFELENPGVEVPKRSSARELISLFNAIGNVTRVTVNSAFQGTSSSFFEKRFSFIHSKESSTTKEPTNSSNSEINIEEKEVKESVSKAKVLFEANRFRRKNSPDPVIPPIAETSESTSTTTLSPILPADVTDREPKPPVTPTAPPAPGEFWTCPRCTLANEKWKIMCEACRRWRPSSFNANESILKNDNNKENKDDIDWENELKKYFPKEEKENNKKTESILELPSSFINKSICNNNSSFFNYKSKEINPENSSEQIKETIEQITVQNENKKINETESNEVKNLKTSNDGNKNEQKEFKTECVELLNESKTKDVVKIIPPPSTFIGGRLKQDEDKVMKNKKEEKIEEKKIAIESKNTTEEEKERLNVEELRKARLLFFNKQSETDNKYEGRQNASSINKKSQIKFISNFEEFEMEEDKKLKQNNFNNNNEKKMSITNGPKDEKERAKLRAMIREIKDSLPKKQSQESSYYVEEDTVHKPLIDCGKIRRQNDADKRSYQPMRMGEFKTIEAFRRPHVYANVETGDEERLTRQLIKPDGIASFKESLLNDAQTTNTLAVNRLLRRLEAAIAGGQHQQAALLARDLARLKISCSVTRQRRSLDNGPAAITVELCVEDKVSHQGPLPLQVRPSWSVAELKAAVEKELEIPVNVQRWILGRQLATDDEKTLSDHGISADGAPIFLYIVTPEGEIDNLNHVVNEPDENNQISNFKNRKSPVENVTLQTTENVMKKIKKRPSPPPERNGGTWYYNSDEERYSFCEDTEPEISDEESNQNSKIAYPDDGNEAEDEQTETELSEDEEKTTGLIAIVHEHPPIYYHNSNIKDNFKEDRDEELAKKQNNILKVTLDNKPQNIISKPTKEDAGIQVEIYKPKSTYGAIPKQLHIIESEKPVSEKISLNKTVPIKEYDQNHKEANVVKSFASKPVDINLSLKNTISERSTNLPNENLKVDSSSFTDQISSNIKESKGAIPKQTRTYAYQVNGQQNRKETFIGKKIKEIEDDLEAVHNQMNGFIKQENLSSLKPLLNHEERNENKILLNGLTHNKADGNKKDLENEKKKLEEITPPIKPERHKNKIDISETNTYGTLKLGWRCSRCTLVNPPTRPGCRACTGDRPSNYQPPVEYKASIQEKLRLDKEREDLIIKKQEPKHYRELVDLDKTDLVISAEPFECPVCLIEYSGAEGVVLRDCLHSFCRSCLANTIQFCGEPEVKCPFRDNNYACDSSLQEREIKALVPANIYEEHLAKSVAQAEHRTNNAFHCKTPDCRGWCIFEDNVNAFKCPVCTRINCLTCQAIHEGIDCKVYQQQVAAASETNADARRTKQMLDEMVQRGEAMVCPSCQVVLMKKWGCDWLRCSMCKTEICWVTRGPRWGPGGKGDTTGGCKCGVNGIKCHPKCNYCH